MVGGLSHDVLEVLADRLAWGEPIVRLLPAVSRGLYAAVHRTSICLGRRVVSSAGPDVQWLWGHVRIGPPYTENHLCTVHAGGFSLAAWRRVLAAVADAVTATDRPRVVTVPKVSHADAPIVGLILARMDIVGIVSRQTVSALAALVLQLPDIQLLDMAGVGYWGRYGMEDSAINELASSIAGCLRLQELVIGDWAAHPAMMQAIAARTLRRLALTSLPSAALEWPRVPPSTSWITTLLAGQPGLEMLHLYQSVPIDAAVCPAIMSLTRLHTLEVHGPIDLWQFARECRALRGLTSLEITRDCWSTDPREGELRQLLVAALTALPLSRLTVQGFVLPHDKFRHVPNLFLEDSDYACSDW